MTDNSVLTANTTDLNEIVAVLNETIEGLNRLVSEKDDRIVALTNHAQRIIERHDEWKERAIETAHRYADNNSLCSEFDRCMEEIGLRGRTRDFTVTVAIDESVQVTVQAANEAEAREAITSSMVEEAVRAVYESSYLDWSIEDVEED